MEDITRLQQAQLDGLRQGRLIDDHSAGIVEIQDRMERAARHERRSNQDKPKRTRGKTNPMQVVGTNENWWDKPLRTEAPARQQYSLKALGRAEFAANKAVSKINKAQKRRSKAKVAKQSRKANR